MTISWKYEAMPRVDEVELVTTNGYARVRLHSSESVDENEIDLGLVNQDEDESDDNDQAEEDHHLLRPTIPKAQIQHRNTRRKKQSTSQNM